jgi:hypothetical protein
VGDKTTGRCFEAPASKLAGINDLYTIRDTTVDHQFIDICLSSYELGFYASVEQLKNCEINALAWASILVPFVAALMVRGPDFNVRFEARIAQIDVPTRTDNTNFARLMEFQRLLAPVAAAKWILLRTQSDEPLITNDLGYAPFANYQTDDYGIAIPLGLDYVLMVCPQTRRTLAFSRGGEWFPEINYGISPAEDQSDLNKVLASISQRFIFGSNIRSIHRYMGELKPSMGVPEPGRLGFIDGPLAMVHEMTWYRLITVLSDPPKTDNIYVYADFLANSQLPQP